jgi:5-hydroxyisourate hydrolase-like protein (transthyretin family)
MSFVCRARTRLFNSFYPFIEFRLGLVTEKNRFHIPATMLAAARSFTYFSKPTR